MPSPNVPARSPRPLFVQPHHASQRSDPTAAEASERTRASWARVLGGAATGRAPQPLGRLSLATASEGSDQRFDGALLVVRDGQASFFAPGAALAALPGLDASRPVALYVNGIVTSYAQQARSMDVLERALGEQIVGVRNASFGAVKDALETAANLLRPAGQAPNVPAVAALVETVLGQLAQGRPVHLISHSQGCAITANALAVIDELLSGARPSALSAATRQQLRAVLRQSVVETFASPAEAFPEGPRYVHYLNRKDVVPTGLGPGRGLTANELRRLGGARASVVVFDDPGDDTVPGHKVGPHDLNELYLSLRRPVAELPPGQVLRATLEPRPLLDAGLSRVDAYGLVQRLGGVEPTGLPLSAAGPRRDTLLFHPNRDDRGHLAGLERLLAEVPFARRPQLARALLDEGGDGDGAARLLRLLDGLAERMRSAGSTIAALTSAARTAAGRDAALLERAAALLTDALSPRRD